MYRVKKHEPPLHGRQESRELCFSFPCFFVNPLSFLAFVSFCAFFIAWFVFPAVSPGWLYFVPSSRRLWRSESL